MRTLLFLLPICVQLLGGTLIGQTIGVRTLALDESATEIERYVKTADGYKLLVFLIRHPGELVDTNVDERNLPIYKKMIQPSEEPSFQVVQQLKLPYGAKSVLILGWSVSGEERYMVVDDKFLDASYNDWLMINTVSKTVGLRIGKDEKPFIIKPNSIQICKVTTPGGKGAAVLGRTKLDDEMETFYSTYWPIREGERSIVIFVEQGERVKVRKISDALLKKSENDEGVR